MHRTPCALALVLAAAPALAAGGTIQIVGSAFTLRPILDRWVETFRRSHPEPRAKIFEAIRAIARDGTTVLYTTHYMEEAEKLCDRIAIMDEGRLIAVGTLGELLQIIGAGDVIEVRAAEAIDPARLSAIPEVREVESADGLTRILVSDAAHAVGPIAALLAERGAVTGLEIHRVSLERVFMHLTGHALRD